MKNMIKKIVCRLWPELDSGTHLPQLAVVVAIPDPPGETGLKRCLGLPRHCHCIPNDCSEQASTVTPQRPHYAVDVRLLLPTGEIDNDMPLIRDVPVAMPAAGPERGFAALPLPGTVVELAWAFGMQSKPFIRSVLPSNLAVPGIEAEDMRWQQSLKSFQKVSAAGSWTRRTEGTIDDIADKIWIGNTQDNGLKLLSDFMASVIEALNTLAGHTHPDTEPISEGLQVAEQASITTILKTKLDAFVKTVNDAETAGKCEFIKTCGKHDACTERTPCCKL